MNVPLLIMLVGAALTVYFTFIEYREGKATQKHFLTILFLDLLVMIIGALQLFSNYSG